MNRIIISILFDGCIVPSNGHWELYPGVSEVLAAWKKAGYEILLYVHEHEYYLPMVEFTRTHDIPYDAWDLVPAMKSDIIIDTRSVWAKSIDWKDIANRVEFRIRDIQAALINHQLDVGGSE